MSDTMGKTNLLMKMNLIYLLIYGALACFYPFLICYFQDRGLSYMEMGIVFAVVSITGVIAQPIWGFITDKYSSKRTIIIITMIVSALAVYSLIIAQSFYMIILSIILLLVFQSPVAPIADAYSYEMIAQQKNMQYGKIRLMGSLGYAIVALVLGYIVKWFGVNSSYIMYSILMVMGVFVLLSIDFQDKNRQTVIRFHDVINLIRDQKFLILLLSVVFANIAMGSNGSYISLLIHQTGGDVTQLGIVWFLVAISELPVFFFAARLISKYGELNLYMLGVFLLALRYFLNSICDSYIQVLVIQIMQGITYTFYLIASLEYLNQITLSQMKTSAITLHAAATSIGGVIGNMGGGILLEHVSIFTFYKILAVICIICLCHLIVLKKIDIKQIKTSP